jgi:hypothetical protein
MSNCPEIEYSAVDSAASLVIGVALAYPILSGILEQRINLVLSELKRLQGQNRIRDD